MDPQSDYSAHADLMDRLVAAGFVDGSPSSVACVAVDQLADDVEVPGAHFTTR
jgi:hypothetical protein